MFPLIFVYVLRAILNKSWQQHPTKHQLYGHLPPITKTIQARRTRHAGHCWRSKNELISDVLLWTPAYGQAKAGRPARTYIQQLCEDTGCSPEDLPEAMNDWEKWWERFRDICASGTTWWWYVYSCIVAIQQIYKGLFFFQWMVFYYRKEKKLNIEFRVVSAHNVKIIWPILIQVYEMISIFLKHRLHLKWYWIFWNTPYVHLFNVKRTTYHFITINN